MIEFCKGEYVNYRTSGVCLIEDIAVPEFASGGEKGEYYILRPVKDKSTTLFVPIKSEALLSGMRHLLAKEEIDRTIESAKTIKIEWIIDRKKRTEEFGAIIKRNDPPELLSLVACMYRRKKEIESLGGNRKMALSDREVLERVERMIAGEFAFVLDIKESEVFKYILSALNEN